MSTVRLSTFINPDGDVVLAWSFPDGERPEPEGCVTLPPEASLGLGKALLKRSMEANDIKNLLNSVKEILAETEELKNTPQD